MDFNARALKEIKSLIQSLNKSNFKKSAARISALATHPIYIPIILFIFQNVSIVNRSEKDECKIYFLRQCFQTMKNMADYSQMIYTVFDNVLNIPKQELLGFILKDLGYSMEDQFHLALIMCHHESTRNLGLRLLKGGMPEFLKLIGNVRSEYIQAFAEIISSSPEFLKERDRIMKEVRDHATRGHFNPVAGMHHRNPRQYAMPVGIPREQSFFAALQQIGYGVCSSTKICRLILRELASTIDEHFVGSVVKFMIRSPDLEQFRDPEPLKTYLRTKNRGELLKEIQKMPSTWNMNVLVDTLKEIAPKLEFNRVLSEMDRPDFELNDRVGFTLFYRFVKRIDRSIAELLIRVNWKHVENQTVLIYFSLMEEIPDYLSNVFRQVDTRVLEQFDEKHQNTCWINIELLTVLLKLWDSDERVREYCRRIFQYPLVNHRNVLICGLVQCGMNNEICKELTSNLIEPALKEPNHTSGGILHYLIRQNPTLAISALFMVYCRDQRICQSILNIIHENRNLVQMFSLRPYETAITLTIEASRRSIVKLHLVVDRNLGNQGRDYADTLVMFIRNHLSGIVNIPLSSPITKEEFDVLLSCLKWTKDEKAIKAAEKIKTDSRDGVLNTIKEAVGQEEDASSATTEEELEEERTHPQPHPQPHPQQVVMNPTANVEDWSTKFFEGIFAGTISIERALNTLRTLKEDEANELSQRKYGTLIHNMFDEFRFFDQYPEAQLRVMAEFFGKVICQELLYGKTLKYALVYILKALTQRHVHNYFTFGIIAWKMIQPKVSQWKEFFQQVCQQSAQFRTIPEIQACLAETANQTMPKKERQPDYPSSDDGKSTDEDSGSDDDSDDKEVPGSPDTNISTGHGFSISYKRMRTFMKQYEHRKPPEEWQNQFNFILNNINQQNIRGHFHRFMEIYSDDYSEYYALKLVCTRISVENNNQRIYSELVSLMNRTFLKSVMKVAYGCVDDLLKSSKLHTDLSERTLFKNLGNWIGLLTIARNRPILKRQLDLKGMLIRGYQTGRLTVIVPFVCKCLRSCIYSRIFHPPNPWIMSILSLLKEIKELEELKVNIKFDIEVCVKSLEISFAEIENNRILTQYNLLVPDSQNMDRKQIPSDKTHAYIFDVKKCQLPAVLYTDLPKKIRMPDGIEIFGDHPYLREVVVVALDQAIKEIITPVVKRSVTISTRATLDLVTKDFVVEKDVQKLQKGAQMMSKALASALSMVTCKEPLRVAMEGRLKTYLLAMCIVEPDPELQRMIEDSSRRVTEENIVVGCVFVEKLAKEQAFREVLKILDNEIQQRRKSSESGGRLPWTMYHRIFSEALKFAPNLPEILLPTEKFGDLQKGVYGHYRTLKVRNRELNQKMSHEFCDKISDCERIIQQIAGLGRRQLQIRMKHMEMMSGDRPLPPLPPQIPEEDAKRKFEEFENQILLIIQSAPNVFEFSVEVQRAFFSRLLTAERTYLQNLFIGITRRIQRASDRDGLKQMMFLNWKDLATQIKFKSSTVLFLRGGIIKEDYVDKELAHLISITQNESQLRFGYRIYEECCVLEYEMYDSNEEKVRLPKLFDMLVKRREVLPIDVRVKVEQLLEPRPEQEKEIKDNRKRILLVFSDWVKIYNGAVAERNYPSSPKLALFIKKMMEENRIMTRNQDFEDMCKVLVDESVTHFLSFHQREPDSRAAYRICDGTTSLLSVCMRTSKHEIRPVMLEVVLGTILRKLVSEHDEKVTKKDVLFQPKPYLRLFSNMLIEMNRVQDKNQVLISKFSRVFLRVEPQKCPGFVFCWMDLISHRYFVKKLLLSKNGRSYNEFHELLIRLLTFLYPFLLKGQLTGAVKKIYKGMIRLLLLLLHDFSNFMCVYHFSLIDAIPPNCFQLRNLILSAYPRSFKLPDPFTPNLKVDLLPEINTDPRTLSDYERCLRESGLKERLDEFLENGKSKHVLEEIKNRFMNKTGEGGEIQYDHSLINSVVLYIGVGSIKRIQEGGRNIVTSSAMIAYRYFTKELDYEGRYIFLNAFVNQLRYPNSQTHYFSCVLLYLFTDDPTNEMKTLNPENDPELVQEQITRVLLERLIVNRPHPWGLLITFIELVKNQRYGFWEKKFIHYVQSIENLFTNVGRGCLRNSDQQGGHILAGKKE